jgi:hypothetical protein
VISPFWTHILLVLSRKVISMPKLRGLEAAGGGRRGPQPPGHPARSNRSINIEGVVDTSTPIFWLLISSHSFSHRPAIIAPFFYFIFLKTKLKIPVLFFESLVNLTNI